MSSAGAYYMTVSARLAESAEANVGKTVRVSGVVVDDSVDYNSAELILKFSIKDDANQVPIYFHGPRPDTFTRARRGHRRGQVWRGWRALRQHTAAQVPLPL